MNKTLTCPLKDTTYYGTLRQVTSSTLGRERLRPRLHRVQPPNRNVSPCARRFRADTGGGPDNPAPQSSTTLSRQ